MAPKRNHPLVLESPERVPDGGGGFATAWVPEGVLWGEIVPGSAREGVVGDRQTARITHRITVLREPGPSRRPRPDQRLRLGERIFAIRGVAEGDPRRATLTLWVEEGPFS